MDKIKQILEQFDKKIQQRDQELSTTLNAILKKQNQTGQIAILEQQKEILSHVYQKAAAYTNLVMIGGYAAAFGIWQLTKEFMSAEQSVIVGSLIIASIILFAGFEVYKMIAHALLFRRLNRIIHSDIAESNRLAAWHNAWTEFSANESKVWLLFLIPTVLTGFGSGLFLLWIFTVNLINNT